MSNLNYPTNNSANLGGGSPDVTSDPDYASTSAEELLSRLGLGEITIIDQPPHSNASGASFGGGGSFPYNAQDQTPTDWNFDGAEGSLPPLKRPDPNQIPADVLSYLLKSGKFNEILNTNPAGSDRPQFPGGPVTQGVSHDLGTSGWGAPNNSQPSSNWSSSPNSFSPEIPQYLHPASTGNSSSVQQQNSFQNQIQQNSFQNQIQENSFQNQIRHRFSPHAPEFVPRQYSPEEVTYHPNDVMRLAIEEVNRSNEHFYGTQQPNQNNIPSQQFTRYASHQGQRGGGGGYRQPRPNFQPRYQSPRPRQQYHFRQSFPMQQQESSSPEDKVLTSVTDTIAHLTRNPADFNKCVRKTLKVLNESLPDADADTLDIVITLIVEQSVANKHFSYTGAKLCQTLNENNIRAGKLTSQNCVITHVQSVFESSLKSIKTTSKELKERVIGLLFFLAELFVNFKMDTGKSFFGFGVAAIEIMTQLIQYDKGSSPDHENVKNVVNVLKLTGWELENHQNRKLKEDMDKLIKELSSIHLAEEGVKPQTKEIIGKVFELKNINWGRGAGDEEETPSAAAVSKSDSPPSSWVTYDGKSQQAVYEIDSSDDDEIYIDDESDEVNQFYEQFLNNLPSNPRKQ